MMSSVGDLVPSVGDMMAAAIAAAGQRVLLLGGRFACETDILAASGARFPDGIPLAELEAFNRKTMLEDMTEDDEMRRYVRIASFFHSRGGARCR